MDSLRYNLGMRCLQSTSFASTVRKTWDLLDISTAGLITSLTTNIYSTFCISTAAGPDPVPLAAVLTPQISFKWEECGTGPAGAGLALQSRISARGGCLTESPRNVRSAGNSTRFLFAAPEMSLNKDSVYPVPCSVVPASDDY